MRSSVEAGLIARSPCDGVRLPAEGRRAMRFLTADQVAALATEVGPDWEALVCTAAYAGLRWGELAGLRPARVELERQTIVVVEQLTELSGRLEWGPPKTASGRRAVATARDLDGLRFHDLRHTAVALAVSKGPIPRRSRNGWPTAQ